MLLTPSEAPTVHIEALPRAASAVQVLSSGNDFTISMWVNGPDMPTVTGESDDDFVDSTCDGCRWYTEEVQVELDGEDITMYHDGEEVYLTGTAYAYSPCPCYSDGVSSVSFPCLSNYDGPGQHEDGDAISSERIRYSLSFTNNNDLTYGVDDEIVIQAFEVVGNILSVGNHLAQAINTYDGGEVCWGSNGTPWSLSGMYGLYTTAPANEDLCNFDTHSDNIRDAIDNENLFPIPDAFVVTKQLPAAVVCAYVPENPSAYLLLATSGAQVTGLVAHVSVYRYSNVAIDEDTIMTVWVTEPLPIGKRLLFADCKNTEFSNGVYLGQVESNFNLEPCKSIQQLSSEPVAPDNSLSPA